MNINLSIEELYRALLEGKYDYLISLPNSSLVPEVEIIKLIALQLKKQKKVNILSDLESITGLSSKYEYLVYEARVIAQGTHYPRDKTTLKSLVERATTLDAIPVFSLFYKGSILEFEKKYKESELCYKTIIQKYPFYQPAIRALSYLLCFSLHNYSEAKKIIKEGDGSIKSSINYKIIQLREYKLFLPLMVVLGFIFWAIPHTSNFMLLGVFSLALATWSVWTKQRFISYFSIWLLSLALTLTLLSYAFPTSTQNKRIDGINLSFLTGLIRNNQPTSWPTPIQKINLNGLLIQENELPAIGWFSGGISNIPPENSGTSEVVTIAYYPTSDTDFAGFDQYVYRYPTKILAEEFFNNPVRKTIEGHTPSEWSFRSSIADQEFFSCDYNKNEYPVCVWRARYGCILIDLEDWLKPGVSSISDMQNIVKNIDLKAKNTIIDKDCK